MGPRGPYLIPPVSSVPTAMPKNLWPNTHPTHTQHTPIIPPWGEDRPVGHVTSTHKSCHTYERGLSHARKSHVPLEERVDPWVVSHIQRCHVTRTNESCHTHKLVISRSKRGKTHGSCHIYKQVMSHFRMRNVKHTNKSCHTRREGRPMSHVTRTNKSYHTHQWVMSHARMSHVPLEERVKPWVMSHIQISHVTRTMSISHTQISHVTLEREGRPTDYVTSTNKSCWVMSQSKRGQTHGSRHTYA